MLRLRRTKHQNAPGTALQTMFLASTVSAAATGALSDIDWQERYCTEFPSHRGDADDDWLQWATAGQLATDKSSDDTLSDEAKTARALCWSKAYHWRHVLEQRWRNGNYRIYELRVPQHRPDGSWGKSLRHWLRTPVSRGKRRLREHTMAGYVGRLVPIATANWGTAFVLHGHGRLLIAPVAHHGLSSGIPGILSCGDHGAAHSEEQSSEAGALKTMYIHTADYQLHQGNAALRHHSICLLQDLMLPSECEDFSHVAPCATIPFGIHAGLVGLRADWLVWTEVRSSPYGEYCVRACSLGALATNNDAKLSNDVLERNYIRTVACRVRGRTLLLSASAERARVLRLWGTRAEPGILHWQVIDFEQPAGVHDTAQHSASGQKAIRVRVHEAERIVMVRSQRHTYDISPPVSASCTDASVRPPTSNPVFSSAMDAHFMALADSLVLLRVDDTRVVLHTEPLSHTVGWLAILDLAFMDQEAPTGDLPHCPLRWQKRIPCQAVSLLTEHDLVVVQQANGTIIRLSLADGSIIGRSERPSWRLPVAGQTIGPIRRTMLTASGLSCATNACGDHILVDLEQGNTLANLNDKVAAVQQSAQSVDIENDDGGDDDDEKVDEDGHASDDSASLDGLPASMRLEQLEQRRSQLRELWCTTTHVCLAQVPRSAPTPPTSQPGTPDTLSRLGSPTQAAADESKDTLSHHEDGLKFHTAKPRRPALLSALRANSEGVHTDRGLGVWMNETMAKIIPRSHRPRYYMVDVTGDSITTL
ncbi:hypothetical protein THASP1DRAFT_24092 [Thamnocephalis sphaerospora]|uniref:Uncharacterized protein n=1 Tax=Thamnocephalis sphaerospora TaxID=78915 RepID=A0A4P9XQN2_9FUNG|nr:hypothetical protein THASP1DRAFT_24092 [Thamnocephalis sphaerospora]|eukprot:RKP07811.1 hypothetical protein THASP1DRAFT_24092 [Thamnocephalis sphaerospora]